MERSTKIYLGVGAAALIAFFVLRNKAAAQKPTTTGGTGTTGGGAVVDHPAGTGSKQPEPPCPAGSSRVQPQCIKAPCPSICMPDKSIPVVGVDHPAPPAGCNYDANWNLVCVDPPAPPVFVDDIMPAPTPAPAPTYPTYPKFPIYGGTNYNDVTIYDDGNMVRDLQQLM